jgi:putative S-methylcysteine transport system substrate-binding protein
MKKTILFLLLGILFVLSACSGSSTSSSDDKVLYVGATGQSYPNSYQEDGKLVGYDVELIENIAENLGYKVEWTTTDFSGLIGQLESGRIDTIANAVAMTDERKDKYAFSEPYSYIGTQIVTAEDNDDIQTIEDLAGKDVAGVLGSNHTEKLEEFDSDNQFNIKTYENREGAMNDVELGRIAGYVNSDSVLSAEMKNRGLKIKFVGDPIAEEPTAFPFQKDDEELKNKVDEQLLKLKEDGTLKALSEKYFGMDTTDSNN